MGARLGTVPGWERISSTTDEPREYIGVGPSKIIYPKKGGDETAEYRVKFDIDLYYCDSPPTNPIVIRTLTNILIIQKFLDEPPNFQEWINDVVTSEALDIYRMSIIEMGGLRECGNDEDNYSIKITWKNKIVTPQLKLEVEKLKEIQKEIDRKKIEEIEKDKHKKIEEKEKIEIIKNQVKIYKEMKKAPEPFIPPEINEKMINYYEEREKELIIRKEKNKKAELRKTKKLERKLKEKKKEELKSIEKGLPIPDPVKKELSTMDIVHISRLQKSINNLEKQKEFQKMKLNTFLAAIERIEESGNFEYLLYQVSGRDIWLDKIDLTNKKIEKQLKAIENIKINRY